MDWRGPMGREDGGLIQFRPSRTIIARLSSEMDDKLTSSKLIKG